MHTKCWTHLLQPLLCILEVAGSEHALNHTIIDLCYFSSGMRYHIVWEAGEWEALYLVVLSDEYVAVVE